MIEIRRTCILTEENMVTEDDCTTHQHEPQLWTVAVYDGKWPSATIHKSQMDAVEFFIENYGDDEAEEPYDTTGDLELLIQNIAAAAGIAVNIDAHYEVL